MKKVIVIVGLILASTLTFGQTKLVQDTNGNYVTQKATKKASEDRLLGKNMLTANGDSYPIYVTERGKYYVVRTAKTSGKEYKQYIQIEN